jgi:hypothetical protein
MKCFQLVKCVLDEIYNQIPLATDDEKDKAIKDSFNYLEDKYRNLLTKEVNVDYSNPITKFAYIYRYVTCHADIIYQLIVKTPQMMEVLSRETVDLTCIGGGPGSDLLGVIKYLTNHSKSTTVRCTFLDKEQSWYESWYDIDKKIDATYKINTSNFGLDVTKPETWEPYKKYLTSDLFTMVYFISEIHRVKSDSMAFFNNLFSQSKPGALFLFIDNNNAEFFEWVDELIKTNKCKVLLKHEGEMTLNYEEEKKDLGIYYEKFGNPRLSPNCVCRIFLKT